MRRCIGLAGQYAAVDETLTGRENLEMVGRLSRLSKQLAAERAAEVLERVSLTDAADRQLKTYSGGMRRRIDLGAGLVARPRVLLLDEPTTGLDPANRLDLWAYLRDLVNEGATILLTTQYLEEADQLASDVVVIDHGAVIASGTPTELKQRLAGDVLDVTVDGDDARPRRRAASPTSAPNGPTVDRGTRRVSLPVDGGAGSLVEVVRRLDEAGIKVVDITLRRPSLDDVFFALTGHTTASGTTDDATHRSLDRRPRRSPDDRHHRPHAGDHAPTPQVSNRLPRGAALNDAVVIAGRNIKHLLRTPQLLVFSVAQTVMFLLLFRVRVRRVDPDPGHVVRRLPDPRLPRADRDLRRLRRQHLLRRGLEVGAHRPVPRAADGALGRRRRPRHRRPAAPGRAARDRHRSSASPSGFRFARAASAASCSRT